MFQLKPARIYMHVSVIGLSEIQLRNFKIQNRKFLFCVTQSPIII